MSWINICLLVVAAIDFLLAVLILSRNPRNKINISFALSVFFVSLWTLGVTMFREMDDVASALFWTYFQNWFGGLVVIPLYFFSLYFPYIKKVPTSRIYISITASIIFLAYIVFIPNVWVVQILLQPHTNNYILNRFGAALFAVYFCGYLVLVFKNLLSKFFTSGGSHKKALKKIILGIGFFGFFGTIFAVLSPVFFGSDVAVWVGPFFSLILDFPIKPVLHP